MRPRAKPMLAYVVLPLPRAKTLNKRRRNTMAGKANPLGKKLCATFAIAGMPIMLHQEAKDRFTVTYRKQVIQEAKDRFTVTYRKQVIDGLTYAQAATALGYCIMRALACDGRLGNRAKGEK